MPSFDTPGPILVTLEIGVGDVRIAASDRSDTNVVVRPSNPTRKSDLAAAEQTRVEFSDGRLLIKAPKGWRHFTPRGGGESAWGVVARGSARPAAARARAGVARARRSR